MLEQPSTRSFLLTLVLTLVEMWHVPYSRRSVHDACLMMSVHDACLMMSVHDACLISARRAYMMSVHDGWWLNNGCKR